MSCCSEITTRYRLYMAVDAPESDWKNFVLVVHNPKKRRLHIGYNIKERRFRSCVSLDRLNTLPDAEAFKAMIIKAADRY